MFFGVITDFIGFVGFLFEVLCSDAHHNNGRHRGLLGKCVVTRKGISMINEINGIGGHIHYFELAKLLGT
jgi:hypothetical protein